MPGAPSASAAALWAGMDRLVGRAGPGGVREHRLEAWAADRLARRGLAVEGSLAEAARRAEGADRLGLMLLARVREALEGPLVLVKGPELAALYPRPALRPSIDLDLLVPDPARAQAILLDSGFEPFVPREDYAGHRHERPIWLPGIPLGVELHRDPGWPDWIDAPPSAALFAAAVPSRTGVPGVSALPDDLHAVAVALHSWQHAPLRDARDLLDLALLASAAGRDACLGRARAHGAGRVMATSLAAADALLLGGRRTIPMRTWARHLDPPRTRTVGAWFGTRVMSPFWALPAGPAAGAAARASVARIRATDEESLPARVASLAASLRRPLSPRR